MKTNEMLKSVALIALAVLFIGGGLIYWQMGNRSAAADRVAQLEHELPDMDKINSDLVKSQQDLEVARIELDHLERALPEQAYIPTLLKELEILGTSKNVKVTGIRPILVQNTTKDVKSEDDAYEKLDIDITGQGTYRALLEMISALKGFPKILAVNTISMVPRQGAGGQTTSELDATIRLRAFIFKEAMAPTEGSTEDLKTKSTGAAGDSGTSEKSGAPATNGANRTKVGELDVRAPRKEVAL
ncbi:MAG: type 4a pilus biogenesis protein PilO [Fimbriimonadaceae bacterium]